MIKRIEVTGLYDVFDHSIELKSENITVIIGENGLGKTIILKMIKSFFDKDYNELFRYPYKEFRIIFESSESIIITKEEDDIANNLIFTYRGTASDDNSETFTLPISQFQRRNYSRRLKARYDNQQIDVYNLSTEIAFLLNRNGKHYIERVGQERWVDHRENKIYNTKTLIDKFKHLFPEEFIQAFHLTVPSWLTEKSEVFTVMLIETQRLLYKSKEGESEYKSSVIKYAHELVEEIKNKTVAATELASKLDKNYPSRIINEITNGKKISDIDIEKGLNKLSKRRELLNEVGLLDTEEEHFQPNSNTIDAEQKNKYLLNTVLQVYINDSNEKLEVYDDLARKLKLLIDIINKRFLYKKLSISKLNGFVFKSTITGKEIPLGGLSSGEQHELVLFYQLLFNTYPSSLLLVDEPEISLHISWQNHFTNDLREVIKLNNFSALIATHSPDIINDNWHLTVKLSGVTST